MDSQDYQQFQKKIKNYYDEFSSKLIQDYIYGNPRIISAIEHTLRWIPRNATRILDIGCGIGWSTWEIKRNFPDACVIGLDISPKLTQIAQTLFAVNDLSFELQDITEDLSDPSQEPFDVIVMLDAYEHIPKERREKVHEFLSKALSAQGFFIASCPSIFHQNYLRSHEPDGLQPVDEDVTIKDIEKLAEDIQGYVINYQNVKIWRVYDYLHVTIQRSPPFIGKNQLPQHPIIALEPPHIRAQRVVSRLKISLPSQEYIEFEKDKPVLCVVSPNQNTYSETFIQSHIDRLPATVIALYRGSFPIEQNNWVQKQFFWENNVEAVLAEYGPSGIAFQEICQQAGLPLIVHFHGSDAYNSTLLKEVGQHYPELFAKAAAMVVVSKDMERQLLDLQAPQEKLHYNPYGVDISLFKGADPGNSEPIFLTVGRFVDKKAPYLTLLAFKEVYKAYPQARLVMIGDGILWESCQQLARTLGIAEVVEFLGACSHAEVANNLRKARAFVQHSVQTSYGDSEGTPVAVLEAGAMGIPVVATRHGGIQDVVIDGETGLLVDEGDIMAMADCMLRLAKKPSLAAKLGQAARRRISAEFSMEKSIGNLWRIIETAIDRHKADQLIQAFNLREINLIICPDWSQSEKIILSELESVISKTIAHPDRMKMTLLIDIGNISEEQASLTISSAVMKLLMEEDIDVSEEPEISLIQIGDLSPRDWSALRPQIQMRILLENEEERIWNERLSSLPSVTVEEFFIKN